MSDSAKLRCSVLMVTITTLVTGCGRTPKAEGDGPKMEFVRIPAGTFYMGSPDSEQGRDDTEGPVEVYYEDVVEFVASVSDSYDATADLQVTWDTSYLEQIASCKVIYTDDWQAADPPEEVPTEVPETVDQAVEDQRAQHRAVVVDQGQEHGPFSEQRSELDVPARLVGEAQVCAARARRPVVDPAAVEQHQHREPDRAAAHRRRAGHVGAGRHGRGHRPVRQRGFQQITREHQEKPGAVEQRQPGEKRPETTESPHRHTRPRPPMACLRLAIVVSCARTP